jgi:SET domain-containing protein
VEIRVITEKGYARVISLQKINKGDAVLKIEGEISSVPSKYSIQIGENKHIESYSSDPLDKRSAWRFINHSCDPNCFIDIRKMQLIALSDIEPGEEITFDYTTTEFEMAAPFYCNCNSGNCLKHIRGKKYLAEKLT